MNEAVREDIDKNLRRAAGVSALRKIGKLVEEEQRVDAVKASALRGFFRYGWIVLLCVAILLTYFMGLI